MSQRYTGLFRCTTLKSGSRILSGSERHRSTNKCIELLKSVFAAIERAKILTKTLRAIKLAQQIPSLPPATLVRHRFVKALEVCRNFRHQNVPRGIDSLEFRKGGREVALVEDRESYSPTKNRIAEITIQAFAESQRPLRAAGYLAIILIRQVLNDLNLQRRQRLFDLVQYFFLERMLVMRHHQQRLFVLVGGQSIKLRSVTT